MWLPTARFTSLAPGAPLPLLQLMEDLEQLKVLENGYRMKVRMEAPHDPDELMSCNAHVDPP